MCGMDLDRLPGLPNSASFLAKCRRGVIVERDPLIETLAEAISFWINSVLPHINELDQLLRLDDAFRRAFVSALTILMVNARENGV